MKLASTKIPCWRWRGGGWSRPFEPIPNRSRFLSVWLPSLIWLLLDSFNSLIGILDVLTGFRSGTEDALNALWDILDKVHKYSFGQIPGDIQHGLVA